jgi:hypothetical protein
MCGKVSARSLTFGFVSIYYFRMQLEDIFVICVFAVDGKQRIFTTSTAAAAGYDIFNFSQ